MLRESQGHYTIHREEWFREKAIRNEVTNRAVHHAHERVWLLYRLPKMKGSTSKPHRGLIA